MTILWTDVAAQDLADISAFIAKDSPHFARKVVEQIFEAVETIPGFPKRGRIVPELGDPRFRELLLGNYRVMYRLHPDAVHLLAVIHGRRNFPDERGNSR